MYTPAQFEDTRLQIRKLRQENATVKRFHQFQKQKAEDLEKVVLEKEKRIRELEREKGKLIEELDRTKRERDSYKGMVFKSKRSCSNPMEHKTGKKRGGQTGHIGVSFQKPATIDRHVHAYLSHCPNCQGELS